MTASRNQDLNEAIYELWINYTNYRNDLAPNFIDKVSTGQLLFVGLNPAFNIRWIGKRLRENKHSIVDPVEYFKWNPIEDKGSYIDRILHSDKTHPSLLYPYYKKFEAIAKELNVKWADIDLFCYRETNQNNLKRIVLSGDTLNEFGLAQFRISSELIRLSDPKVIIFANALSSSIFKRNYIAGGFKSLLFDEKCGYHWLEYETKKIPVFFSGMLTGQRALDIGSYERLKWHIKQALLTSTF